MLRKSLAAQEYFIKQGYRSRLNNNYFVDTTTKHLIFQPEVYQLAEYLAERSGATHIIDVGAGNGLKLVPLAKKFQIIAIDHKSNMKDLRINLPGQQCLESDLEEGLPNIDESILKNSIVISADVIEHIKRPDKYLKNLAGLSHLARYVLISTPDRTKVRGVDDFGPPDNPAHVREWSLDELNNLVANAGFSNRMCGYTINTNIHQRKSTSLIIAGSDIYPKNVAPNFPLKSVQAIVTVFNEGDIIRQVVQHLINQGVAVHIIDNWSTDDGYEKVKKMSKQNSHITFERFPAKKPKYYEWGELLKRVEDVAEEGKYNWYIHYDADEIRLSPWVGVPLRQAISFVDSQGYNALDFTVLDFRPVEDGFNGSQLLEEHFLYCEFGKRPGHFQQVKAWKWSHQKISLANSGGHDVVFEGRRVYPVKFITKHYPLRSSAQAKRKIFDDRLPRLSPAEKKKGWHIQYNDFDKTNEFIWQKESLVQFANHEFHTQYLVELISGIGNNPNS